MVRHACVQVGDARGAGEPAVVIEMVSSTQTTLTDQLSAQDAGSEGGGREHGDQGDAGSERLFRDNRCSRAVERVQEKVHTFLDSWKALAWKLVKATLLLAYIAYFAASMALTFADRGTKTLLGGTVVVVVIIGFKRIHMRLKRRCLPLADYTTGGSMGAKRLRKGARW